MFVDCKVRIFFVNSLLIKENFCCFKQKLLPLPQNGGYHDYAGKFQYQLCRQGRRAGNRQVRVPRNAATSEAIHQGHVGQQGHYGALRPEDGQALFARTRGSHSPVS